MKKKKKKNRYNILLEKLYKWDVKKVIYKINLIHQKPFATIVAALMGRMDELFSFDWKLNPCWMNCIFNNLFVSILHREGTHNNEIYCHP